VPNIRNLEAELRETMGEMAHMDPSKFDWALRDYIEGRHSDVRTGEEQRDPDRWLQMDPMFAGIYMTLLAQEIAQQERWGAVTDTPILDNLFQEIFASWKLWKGPSAHRTREVVLVDVIFDAITIEAKMPLEAVLNYRDEHREELTRLRTELFLLAGTYIQGNSPSETREAAREVYERVVEPKLNDLRKSLSHVMPQGKAGRMKLTLAALGVVGVAASLATGEITPVVLGTTMIAAAAIPGTLFTEHAEQIEQSPYAYLLTLESRFGQGRPR